MRISSITENTVDVASDINFSLLEADGIIPMQVETMDNTPIVAEAVKGKYYAENGIVLTLNETEDDFRELNPVCVVFDGKIFVKDGSAWVGIYVESEVYTKGEIDAMFAAL